MSEAQFGPLADRYARQFGVPPRLFRLLIRAESSWNPNAASGAGARGLTQVVPKWHPNADLSTPQGQLEYGAKHLGSLLKKYGNARDALAVYNSGKPWSVSQNYGETNAYVTKILGQFGSGAPQSGGAAPADVGPVPPAGPASLPPPPQDVAAGQLDAKKLLKLLRGQTERSLQGIMPTQNFRSTLMDLAEDSLPRAQTYVAGKTVGTVVASAASTVGAAADKSSAQVINAAKEQLGVPYSWGGGTPSGPGRGFGRGANTVGFDCSSLVQFAWAKAGVNLPRTTYEQIKVGKGVPANNPAAWQPGDLLFPSTGHVQMYVGNGKVIEAPRTGGKVQVVGLRPKYIAVRRPA